MDSKKYTVIALILITTMLGLITGFSGEYQLPAQEDRLNCTPAFPENPVKQSVINNTEQMIEVRPVD